MPLLRRKEENIHATVLTLFLNAVHEMHWEDRLNRDVLEKELQAMWRITNPTAAEFVDARHSREWNSRMYTMLQHIDLFRDGNRYFER